MARWGLVCSLIGSWSALTSLASAAAPLDLPDALVFPARSAGPQPITVLLHGMCGDAARTCRHFADEVSKGAHLICPRATRSCVGGGASWPERGTAEVVERAIGQAIAALNGAADDTRGRTLIGYSMGAFRAVGIVQGGSTTRYPRVMLIGAKVTLDQARLEQSGVERLLLCAGSWDRMHDPMQRTSKRLQRGGFSARFMNLGAAGHAFTPSFARYLPEALAWLDAH